MIDYALLAIMAVGIAMVSALFYMVNKLFEA